MADLSEDEQKELAKIRETEDFWKDSFLFREIKVVPFNDEDALKFHKYMKSLAQSMLGNEVDLDKEDIVFILSDDKQANAAFMPNKGNKEFIFITAGLLDECDNKDQFAFVLGHELQHFLENKRHGQHANTKSEEEYADLNAIPKLVNAGLNIEQAKVMADKIFKSKHIFTEHLRDEHVSDPNRRTLLEMGITAERNRLIGLGKASEDVTGDKIHLLEDDFLSLVHNRPHPEIERESLQLFFESEQYVNASYEERVDMWFEKVESKITFKEDDVKDKVYADLKPEDVAILANERKKLFDEVTPSKMPIYSSKELKNRNYHFEKRYLDFMLNEPNWKLAQSKAHMMYEIFQKNKTACMCICPPELFGDYVKEKFGGLRNLTDKNQILLTLVNLETLERALPENGLETLIGKKLLDLSYTDDDIGKSFSKEILYTADLAFSDKYMLDNVYYTRRMNNGDIILRDRAMNYNYIADDMWFLLNKEGKIQFVADDREKINDKMVANQINDIVTVLNDIRNGKEIDANFKINTLMNAWKLDVAGIVGKDNENGEKIIVDTVLESIHHKSSKVANVEQYLTSEAKDFVSGKHAKEYSDLITTALADSIQNDFDVHSLEKIDNILRDDKFVQTNSDHIEQIEKIVKAYVMRSINSDRKFSWRVMQQVSDVALCQHLKAGKSLDDFEFPFREECLAYQKKKSRLDVEMGTYCTYEMLRKNPEIDLSQVTHSGWSAIPMIKIENESYFTKNLGKEKLEELKQRIQDNFDNPKNWGDGTIEPGMSDAPFKERFFAMMTRSLYSTDDRLQNIALYFYEQAPIEDKIDYYAQALHTTINPDAEEDVNKAVKEKVWNVIRKDFENQDIPLEQRYNLFLKATKYNLFDEGKVHYFEVLVGKDGQGGLLKEFEKAPDPKLNLYMELLNKDNRIPDPEIRAKVISLAVKQMHKENGNYNDIEANDEQRQAFAKNAKQVEKQYFWNMPATDKYQFLKELAEVTLAQEELCDVIKPNPPKVNTQDMKLISGAYGLDTFAFLMQEGAIKREVLVNLLLGDGSEKSIMEAYKAVRQDISNYNATQEFSLPQKYLNRLTPQHFEQAKKEFDSAPLEGKAAIINLLSAGNGWEEQFTQVAGKLFEGAGELGEVGQKFLKSYISSRPESERCFYLSAMFAAANNKSTTYFDDGKSPYTPEQRSLAQGLRLFLENSGPAGVKLAQAMSSYNGVPDFIRDEMQKAKNSANPPARWEVFDWLESAGEKNMLEQGKLGKLLGSASFFVTYDMKGNDGTEKVVKIMRRGSESMANAEFKVYKEMLGKLKKEFPWVESFSRLVQNASDMVKVETNLDIGEQQLRDAQKLYPDKASADKVEFNLKVMDWDARGNTWASMEKAHGKDFKDLEQPYKKAVAKAVFTTELANMLSGKRFDADRHAGQYKIDPETNTIGIFDTGSMSIVEPTDKEKRVLGVVIAETVKTLAENPNENIGAVLCSEIDKGIEKYYKAEIADGKPIPPYLSEFQRGLLALSDFHQEIPAQELAMCLVQSLNNGKHKLSEEIYKGFVAKIADFTPDKSKKGKTEKKDKSDEKMPNIAQDISQQGDNNVLQAEAHFAQSLGKLAFKQVMQSGDLYGTMISMPENLKNPKIMEVLNSDVGRIHFAKGMMKGVFDAIDPKHYSAEDKKQMGEILYNVIENSAKQKKLKKQISVTDIFDKVLDNTPQLGEYAKKVKAMMQIISGSEVNIDLKQFKKAVILSRMADKDVQEGYMNALRKSPDTSLFKKALSRINPISFIPRGSTRKVAKYIVKTVAPKCLKAINKFRENTNKQVKAQQRD